MRLYIKADKVTVAELAQCKEVFGNSAEISNFDKENEQFEVLIDLCAHGKLSGDVAFLLSALGELATTAKKENVQYAESEGKANWNKLIYSSVYDLDMSVRAECCLKNSGIRLIGELVMKTDEEMLKIQNFGRKTLNELKDLLVDQGLTFGMKL